MFSAWQGAYGNLVVVENEGYRVYLAHNSDLKVLPGEVVSAGDVVAVSGSTGNSSGFHVHFEVRVCAGAAWTAIDPLATELPGQSRICDWYDLAIPLH